MEKGRVWDKKGGERVEVKWAERREIKGVEDNEQWLPCFSHIKPLCQNNELGRKRENM